MDAEIGKISWMSISLRKSALEELATRNFDADTDSDNEHEESDNEDNGGEDEDDGGEDANPEEMDDMGGRELSAQLED